MQTKKWCLIMNYIASSNKGQYGYNGEIQINFSDDHNWLITTKLQIVDQISISIHWEMNYMWSCSDIFLVLCQNQILWFWHIYDPKENDQYYTVWWINNTS